MSTPFYDLASLVVVPSGYKASKVYAQKPLTTDGQLTFSRASTATRVNSAGLIETVSSNVPRLDYLGSTCGKLILEPQRTNAILWSEQINTTNWPSSSQINATENALVSPDGTQNADIVIPNTANANHGPAQNVFGLTSGATYSCSIYAKAQGYSKFKILAGAGTGSGEYEFDLTAGTAQAGATITSVGNGWYRCTAPMVPNSSLLQYLIFISNGSAYSYAGNGTSGIAFWGAQVEAGAYATSYIPTLGAAVTRGADACSKTGISSLIGQTEGTLFVDVDLTHSSLGNDYILQIFQDSTNRILLYRSFGNVVGCFLLKAGGSIYDTTSVSAFTGRTKLAFAYKSGSIAFYINGSQIATSSATFTAFSSFSDFNIDSNNGTENGYFSYNQALLFKTRLTNAQLAELTAL